MVSSRALRLSWAWVEARVGWEGMVVVVVVEEIVVGGGFGFGSGGDG